MMRSTLVTVLGKGVRAASRLRGGSGSALPGLVVEKIDPHFVKQTLAQLPHGVVLVSGTNGKTTTTKMVVELLEKTGLKVFTNRTGSNFTRGVAAALLSEIDIRGTLHADIAVLELDEAHAVHFVRAVAPRYSLLLNVMRDQLDRFGEIDYTANLLRTVAEATTEKVVINREDGRLRALADTLPSEKVVYFGLSTDLEKRFPSDDSLRGEETAARPVAKPDALTELVELDGKTAVVRLGSTHHDVTLKLDGIYNVFNAVGALAMVASIVDDASPDKLIDSLAAMTPAFGRGETITVDGQPVELVLVKNPGGFRLGLQSFDPRGVATMIAINDNYADGRDMSWLWDVEFDSLRDEGVAIVSGVRAHDMALRLQYDDVALSIVEPNVRRALELLLTKTVGPKRIYCTYTAMLSLRRELAKRATVEMIG